MKTARLFVIMISIATMPACASRGFAAWWYGRDWAFVQSVGGIAVGSPVRDSDGDVILPVRCDVSGSSKITVEPTIANSAMSVRKVRARAEDRTITLSLFTFVYSSTAPSALCPDVNLGDVPSGTFVVLYRGADEEDHPIAMAVVP